MSSCTYPTCVLNESLSTDDEEDGEVQTRLSQMNLTNWLKSWGSEEDPMSEAQNMSHQDYSKQSIQSKRDGLLNEQLS
jgi:hypothetical protein